MKQLLTFSLNLILVSFCSCIQLKVKPKYFSYCPYKVNDIVVFQNITTSTTDTIFINSVDDHKQPDGPGPILVNRHTYRCCGYTSVIKNYLFTKPREQSCLMTIIPNYKAFEGHRNNNGIEFSIYKHNSINLNCFVRFEDLSKIKSTKITVNEIVYDAVLEIYPNMKNTSSECVKVFYWRSDLGYIKFVTNGGTEYILKDKFNNPEILKKIINEETVKDQKWKNAVQNK